MNLTFTNEQQNMCTRIIFIKKEERAKRNQKPEKGICYWLLARVFPGLYLAHLCS